MKKLLLPLLPCLAVLTALFYLLPLLARDTGGAMFLMLCVTPLAAFLTGLVGPRPPPRLFYPAPSGRPAPVPAHGLPLL